MVKQCACGSKVEAHRIIPVWLIVMLFFCGIFPGIVALYCHNRVVACGGCGHIYWQF